MYPLKNRLFLVRPSKSPLIHAKELKINWTEEPRLLKTTWNRPTVHPFYSLGCWRSNLSMFVAGSKIIANWQNRVLHHPSRCGDFVLRDFFQTLFLLYLRRRHFRTERGRTEYDGKTLQEIKTEDQKRAVITNTMRRRGDSLKNIPLSINASKSLDKWLTWLSATSNSFRHNEKEPLLHGFLMNASCHRQTAESHTEGRSFYAFRSRFLTLLSFVWRYCTFNWIDL